MKKIRQRRIGREREVKGRREEGEREEREKRSGICFLGLGGKEGFERLRVRVISS